MGTNNRPVLSICITSYKRIRELQRCLLSIDTKYTSEIEIIVSEDHSPLSNEIKAMVEEIAKQSVYKIIFNTNEVNLGYDNNLGKLISLSNGQYILLLSDDDSLIKNALDKIIDELKQAEDVGVIFEPFIYESKGIIKRDYKESKRISQGEQSAEKYLFDSILFSGLIFRSDLVINKSAEKFKNMNYFQVYLFLSTLLHSDGLYLNIPLVNCIGDGENAYGIAESSGINSELANRKSVISNLEFHKGLINVIMIVDKENNTHILDAFSKEYSLRTYTGLSLARKEGKAYYKKYWDKLNSLNVKLDWHVKVYYLCLKTFGFNFCNLVLGKMREMLINSRK